MTNFLKTNAVALASIVVAISSLFVAVVSLRYTVQSQQEDRAYKELMIQPILQIVSDTDTGSVIVANTGLGPAKIGRVLFHSKEHCIDTDSVKFENNADFEKYIHNFGDAISEHMLVGMPVDDRIKTLPAARSGILPPGTIIPAGKEMDLFKFNPDDLRKLLTKLDTSPGEYHQMFLDNFAKRGSSIPIQMEYCSLSGNFCSQNKRISPCSK